MDTFLRSSTTCAENFDHIEFEDFHLKYLYYNVGQNWSSGSGEDDV